MEKIFNMTEKDLTLYNLILKTEEKSIKQVKAAELLGISDRHFRRLLKAYKEQGPQALASKKRGRPSNSRMKESVRIRIVEKLKSTYKDCGPTFVWQKLVKVEQIKVSHETVRKIMMEEGLWESKKRKRLKLHQQRLRRPAEGELIQLDGSTHAWFEGRGPKCCLLGFIDDATSKIMHLRFVASESTAAYFQAFKEYLRKHGKPVSFYSDRLSVFRVNNDKEGYRKEGLTQVGRALKELDIELICANSPQAKGRVERMFNTLQDRLIKEMRLRAINSVEEGNLYLEEYIKEHNAFFSIKALEEINRHRPCNLEEIDRVFCYKEKRKLSKNLELSYSGRILQIQTEQAGYALRGAAVDVVEDLQGAIKITYQGKELDYKELLVRDHQGHIKNKKEILLGLTSPSKGVVA
ncbi:MAG: ISNCY family transposase [Betaproteobacteria bacterium]|nr:ISNCY family transposase [Betaproteobacteria bacterium]